MTALPTAEARGRVRFFTDGRGSWGGVVGRGRADGWLGSAAQAAPQHARVVVSDAPAACRPSRSVRPLVQVPPLSLSLSLVTRMPDTSTTGPLVLWLSEFRFVPAFPKEGQVPSAVFVQVVPMPLHESRDF
jgi:hypothetical protein